MDLKSISARLTPKQQRSFVVVGLGAFGSTVASELMRFGNHVIGVDIDDKLVGAQAETLSQTLILDARDDGALRAAGLGDCEVAVIAIGDSLEANVLAAINLRMLGVETIWAKAMSRTHHRILSKLGVDRVIHPEEDVGLHIAQVLHNPLVRDFVSLGNGYHVVNIAVPEALDGTAVSDLKLDDLELRCLGTMRGSEFRAAGDGPLQQGDYLLLLGKRTQLRDFASSL